MADDEPQHPATAPAERAPARRLKPKAAAKPVMLPLAALPKTLTIETPDLTFSELFLSETTTNALRQVILEHELAAEMIAEGVAPTTKLLFEGPPGTGKTSAAGALATAIGLPFVLVHAHEVVSSYMGESETRLAGIFDYARDNRAVYLLDEIDGMGSARATGDDSGSTRSYNAITTTLLTALERLRGQSIIVAATNRLDALDTATRRRFDVTIPFAMPTHEQRDAIVKRILGTAEAHIANMQTLGIVESIADGIIITTPTLSHADITRICMAEKRRRVVLKITDQRLRRARARGEM